MPHKNTDKNIELELRSELTKDEFDKVFDILKNTTEFVSEVDRFFVVFFGEINKTRYDCRVRISNGEAEAVVKKGGYHKHNRREVYQPIRRDQFMGFVRIFNLFDFAAYDAKVCHRKIYNFRMPGGIDISIAGIKDIYYLEVEKITDRKHEDKVKEELTAIMKKWGEEPISKDEFYALCKRLDTVDWKFTGSDEDYQRVEKELKDHGHEKTVS